jgi:type IV secretory pathway VirB10-like protein
MNNKPKPVKVPARIAKDMGGQEQWKNDMNLLAGNLAEMHQNVEDMEAALPLLRGADYATQQKRQDYQHALSENRREIQRQERMLKYVKSGTPLQVVAEATTDQEFSGAVAKYEREEAQRQRELPLEERVPTENQRQWNEANEKLAAAETKAQEQFPTLLTKFHGNYERARLEVLRLNRVREAGDEKQEVRDES